MPTYLLMSEKMDIYLITKVSWAERSDTVYGLMCPSFFSAGALHRFHVVAFLWSTREKNSIPRTAAEEEDIAGSKF